MVFSRRDFSVSSASTPGNARIAGRSVFLQIVGVPGASTARLAVDGSTSPHGIRLPLPSRENRSAANTLKKTKKTGRTFPVFFVCFESDSLPAPPVSFNPEPAAPAMHPVPAHPYRVRVRRHGPVSMHPYIAVPVPALVSINPYVPRPRSGWPAFHQTRRRTHAHINLPVSHRGAQHGCRKGGQQKLLHRVQSSCIRSALVPSIAGPAPRNRTPF